jgi:hypothetical protein
MFRGAQDGGLGDGWNVRNPILRAFSARISVLKVVVAHCVQKIGRLETRTKKAAEGDFSVIGAVFPFFTPLILDT